jgi:hypothetical protein
MVPPSSDNGAMTPVQSMRMTKPNACQTVEPVAVVRGQGVGDRQPGVDADHGEPLVAECFHESDQVPGRGAGVVPVLGLVRQATIKRAAERSISLGYRWRGEEVLDGRRCGRLASRKCELPTQLGI